MYVSSVYVLQVDWSARHKWNEINSDFQSEKKKYEVRWMVLNTWLPRRYQYKNNSYCANTYGRLRKFGTTFLNFGTHESVRMRIFSDSS